MLLDALFTVVAADPRALLIVAACLTSGVLWGWIDQQVTRCG